MKSVRTGIVVAGFALAALGFFNPSLPAVHAADVTSTWSIANSGNWNVNANWTNVPALGGFPNNGNGSVATYDATISSVGSPYTVTLSTNITVEDLLLNSASATVNQTAGTFTATGAIALSAGTFQVNGGTISNTIVNETGGTLAIASNVTNLLSGVTVNGDLTLNTNGAVTKIAGGTTFATAHLAANATDLGFAPGQTLSAETILFDGATTGTRHVEMNGTAGSFTIGASGVIRTNAGLAGDGNIGAAFQYGGAMTLANNGLISSQVSGRTITIGAASLTNSATGILEATGGGILTINSTNWSNAGNLRALTGSTANLNGAWSNLGGTITADATSTLNLGGSFSTPNLGTLSLAAGSNVNVTGAWDNSGQNFTFNAATGSWTLNGGSITGGSLGFANSTTLAIAANNTNLLSGVTVNGDLTLNTTSAVTKIAGGTTFATAHLAANATDLGFAPGQTLSAETILFDGAANGTRHVELNGTTAGTFTIGATGVIRTNAGLAGDGNIGAAFQYSGAMTLANNGLISSQVSGRTITIGAASLTNSATGILEATGGGILTINSTNWSNAGNLRALTGSTANLNGAWSNLGGTITADATSTLNLGGSFSTPNLGTLSLAAGSNVSVTGAWDNSGQNFIFNSATGSWTLNGGTITGGSLGFADNKTLAIAANNANLLSGVTVNGDLTLNTSFAVAKIAAGTTFATAHLAANGTDLGFAPGQTLSAETILFDGANNGTRHVELNGTAGSFTIGATGVIRTNAGLTGDGNIGAAFQYGGAMALTNNGLISSQVSGRTITVDAASLTNSATGILEATGGGLLTINSTNWSSAGNLRALSGSTANLNGAWSNLGGTITADATSTLNLGGSFSTPNLGTLSLAAGSNVNVTGAWDNSGQNFTFNAATGSWALNGGSITGGSLSFANSTTLVIAANNTNLLSGVTVNGDLTLNTTSAVTKIAGGTTFATAHLAANAADLGFAPGQTLSGTILFEGAANGTRHVELNGTAGSFTIGATGVIRTNAGLTGDANLGGIYQFGGAMTLANNGLISSQVSGRTITVSATGVTNGGTLEAVNGGILAVPLGYTQTAGITRVDSGGIISALNLTTLNTITVAGGRLEGSGTIMANVANSATISPGVSAGILAITGDLNLAPTSTVQIEIGGTTPGTQYDQLHVTGQLALGGTLNVSVINSFNLAAGNLFDFLDWGSVNGKFSSVILPPLSSPLAWYTSQLYNNGRVSVIDTNFLPGDFNRDGHVNVADIPVMVAALSDLNVYKSANSLTSAQLLSIGDIDLSGTVTNADVQALLNLLKGGGGSVAAVPEPASLVLLALALPGLAFAVLRRRASSWSADYSGAIEHCAIASGLRHQPIGA